MTVPELKKAFGGDLTDLASAFGAIDGNKEQFTLAFKFQKLYEVTQNKEGLDALKRSIGELQQEATQAIRLIPGKTYAGPGAPQYRWSSDMKMDEAAAKIKDCSHRVHQYASRVKDQATIVGFEVTKVVATANESHMAKQVDALLRQWKAIKKELPAKKRKTRKAKTSGTKKSTKAMSKKTSSKKKSSSG